MIAVLLWGDVENNPNGFPADYPAEMMELPVGSKITPPWVEMSKVQYEALSLKSREIAKSLIDQKRSEAAASDAQKLDTLKRLFDDGKVIRDAWPSLTNAQKFDLIPIVFDLLFKQRHQMLAQYRPE